MKWWSRTTLGIGYGIINVLWSIGHAIVLFVKNEMAFGRILFAFLIVLCLIKAIISGLVIIGIIKRRHRVMLPWISITLLILIYDSAKYVLSFLNVLFYDVCLSAVFQLLILGVVGYGADALILWAHYTLYRDIRQENIRILEYTQPTT